ncbi:hypothetical protein [Alienimonas californiensis]|uniref:Uncharacterized protein n=1 Tax=Alienimonas californiensis TaxID=2527989 RepID=A0A517P5U0_9PLAN|nr:hypothetical protein [Alienimonas californiensis]QDT14744.1 hypothetical protein CA12_08230 [Alienimonas californiensis]
MGGEVITKVLVLLAGLIAMGACAGPLLYDPAVEEAEEENVLQTEPRGPLLGDAKPVPAIDEDANLDDGNLDDGALIDEEPGDDAVVVDTLPEEAVIGGPVPEAAEGEVAATTEPAILDVPDLAGDPERTVIPFFVTLPVLLIALALTVWAMVTPAAALGRPALIAGLFVLLGTLLAWGLYEAGLSEFAMNGTALTAWLCVGFTLLAAWLVIDVLSTPSEDEAVPG